MTLISLEFLTLAVVAMLLLPLLRGAPRGLLFLALGAVYAWSFLGPIGSLSTVTFVIAGYGIARWAASGSRWAVPVGVGLLTAAFIYMRNYSLLKLFLPQDWRTDLLVTAGLSFLFFKVVHVIVDAGPGTLGRLSFPTYLGYCANFTTFLLGPIQRYQDFDAQWSGRERSIEPGFEARLDAFNRVLRGMVKKFVIAEALRPWVIDAEMRIEAFEAGELMLRTYLFYFYLYFDFSGYCDIMIGIGAMMGVRPPENFNLPFLSRNVSDYWLRVHKSLTLWLTDYVFTPTYATLLRMPAMRKLGLLALAMALMVTMFVSGLWHGTTLSFLCFGLVHGVFLVTSRTYEAGMIRLMGRKGFNLFRANPLVHGAAVFLTFNVTSLAYAFFVMDLPQVKRLMEKLLWLG